MTFVTSRKIWLAVVLALVILGVASVASAQDDTPDCPNELEGEPVGCAHVYLPQETLLGDFYLDGELIFAQYPGFFLTTSIGSHQIDVRNIQSTEEGFGELFTYEDTSKTVWISQGRSQEVTLYPKKTFIRGTLELTCDIRDVVEGDSVACQVAIDDIPQESTVPAGEKANYILDPGEHKVTVTLVGDQANLWAPASDEATANVRAGSTARVSIRFQKRAHLTLTLDQEGVLSDLYVNDELVAAQVATTDLWLEPNKNYTVEARNITDPAAGDLYHWKDTKTFVYLKPAQEKTVEFQLKQEWLKGFYAVTCNITNWEGQNVTCNPTIDEVPMDPVPPGETVEYPLDPGSHNVIITLEPVAEWLSEPITQTPYITAGRTTKYTAIFTLEPATVPEPTPTAAPPANPYPGCPNMNCSDFGSCGAVRQFLDFCPQWWSDLDRDHDGVPCESLCG